MGWILPRELSTMELGGNEKLWFIMHISVWTESDVYSLSSRYSPDPHSKIIHDSLSTYQIPNPK